MQAANPTLGLLNQFTTFAKNLFKPDGHSSERSELGNGKRLNPKFVQREKFMNRQPKLKLEDKDMPILDRLRKSVHFNSRKENDEALMELEAALADI